ncbi:hypothetical protein E4U42_003883 [Claviceps africana]|uniref:Uncharacterized protein n=1 Tax=Claviceps africana TaxID=83212 RepID=A0A8K0J6H9_9HYPO|nr:hypothetical protein E4U42_003883 [Claviceps africana]
MSSRALAFASAGPPTSQADRPPAMAKSALFVGLMTYNVNGTMAIVNTPAARQRTFDPRFRPWYWVAAYAYRTVRATAMDGITMEP